MRISIFLVVLGLLFGLTGSVAGQTVYVSGLAPNWDQPNDYPDAYDPSRAWGPSAAWNAWCTPTSAAMLVGHWEDVHVFTGMGDGSADGNQALPGGYLPGYGPRWGFGATWHDYCADGEPTKVGPHPLRNKRTPKDLGWYMDTNRLGDPRFGNPPHVGTFYKDVAPGLTKFFSLVDPSMSLKASTKGVNPVFGGKTVAQLATMIKNEIDSNRVVIAHFSHWNIIGPPGPGQGNGTEDSEDDFYATGGYADYQWGSPTPGGRDEVWNLETGELGLGHSVLVVGYIRVNNTIAFLIVHDNWPTTVRNVVVPIYDFNLNQWRTELVAITKVTGGLLQ